MRGWTAAVLLLLVLTLISADRSHDTRNLSREARLRRHDSEERASGRRWTSSRNSPYQKVVSSFEQDVPDLREASSQKMETATPEEPDQAKAKNLKRKHWRTRAPNHDLIPSETSSDMRGTEHENESSELSDDEEPEVRSQKPSGAVPRRRTSTNQSKDNEAGENTEVITPNPKKRRRPPTSTTTTTTLAPQTMSDSLYQHFRPLDQDVPQDDIIPFLDFGRKLSPVLPTPSGANSIENRSSVTKLKPRAHQEVKESPSADEDMLQEDMDVSVVKKVIERNSVPRGKLRVREQGISDYYRKRAPPQVRTTENLISSSDSSTASSIQGPKGILVLKKINRHQIHHVPAQKAQETPPKPISLGRDELRHFLKNVELLEEKYKDQFQRSDQRSSALTEETHHSPLTAESSVVKTVIKEVPLTEETTTKLTEIDTTSESTSQKEHLTKDVNTQKLSSTNHTSISENEDHVLNSAQRDRPKILSTAVVTSISIQETLQDAKNLTTKVPHLEVNPTVISSSNTTSNHSEASSASLEKFIPETTTLSFLPPRNLTTPKQSNNSAFVGSPGEPITTPMNAKSETPLRSRDIYKPKAIPPGAKIPHLPRQIPFLSNTSRTLVSPATLSSIASSSNITSQSQTTSSSIVSSTTKLSSTTSTSTTTPTTSTLRVKFTPKVKLVPIPIPEEIPYIEISKEVKSVKPEDETQTTTEIPTRVLDALSTTEGTQHEKDFSTDLSQPSSTENSISSSSKIYEEEPLETESVPPPRYDESSENLTFVPVQSPEEDSEDQFPIYFTTLPTVTKPVVDTRPETEAAVVPQGKNTTSPRIGADWVKVGVADKEVEVVLPEPLGAGAYILAGLGVVPILIGALIGAKILVAHNKKKVLDESEYSSEYNRSPLGNATASPLPTKLPRIPTHVNWNETEKSPPPLPPPLPPPPNNNPVPLSSTSARWEFPREKLRLQTLLGQGNFGQVWKAEADDISGHEGLTRLVAVKSVKESANTREREDLLRELGILQELGSHPNVVTLLGCCTEKEPIYLIMEYVMYGKLLSFLRDYRTRAHYYNFSDAGDALSSRDLTVFGYCVARGMDYLTNKSIIHRDMAARNVLVDHNKLCKIADFGMSRNVRDTGQIYEQRQSKGALPIRWMAPESLAFSLFTHKTDVWSFGILMWEIVTLGSTPYATMGAREVMRRVQDGYRLERPSHCRPELFRLIAQCWHSEPSKRPTFSELKAELGVLLSDSTHNGSLVDLERLAEEMRRDTLHRHH